MRAFVYSMWNDSLAGRRIITILSILLRSSASISVLRIWICADESLRFMMALRGATMFDISASRLAMNSFKVASSIPNSTSAAACAVACARMRSSSINVSPEELW